MGLEKVNDALQKSGMETIRHGDTVYILNNLPSKESIDRQINSMRTLFGEYRCPFSFLQDFEKWWEWHDRKHSRQQSTGFIIGVMVGDQKVIDANRIEPKAFRCYQDFMPSLFSAKKSILFNGSA